MANQTIHMTHISFPNGLQVVAPTSQWIACIFDTLHPEQQQAVIESISALAQAQQDRPLVTIPGQEVPHPFMKSD